jgi:hypothetical protein
VDVGAILVELRMGILYYIGGSGNYPLCLTLTCPLLVAGSLISHHHFKFKIHPIKKMNTYITKGWLSILRLDLNIKNKFIVKKT